MAFIDIELLRSGFMAAAVASVHLWGQRLGNALPGWREVFLPFVGGLALGYAVVYMLPKLGAGHQSIVASDPDAPLLWQFRTYLALLLGIQLFVVLGALARSSVRGGVLFKTAVAAGRAGYSFLGGYLLVDFAGPSALAQGLAALVLGLHLMGLDAHLSGEHGRDRTPGWVLATAVLCGALTGMLLEWPGLTRGLTALLAGGILMVVMNGELAAGSRRPAFFLAGSLAFVAIAAVGRAARY